METRYPIAAYYLAKTLPLPLIERRFGLSPAHKRRNFLLFRQGEERLILVFSYGVVVLFGFDPKNAKRIAKQLTRYGVEPVEKPRIEEYEVAVDPGRKPSVEFDFVILDRLDPDYLYVIAEVLAQSVAIEYVEERAAEIVAKFEKVYEGLEQEGKLRADEIGIRKAIGAGRNLVQYVISHLSLLDKPDVTWDDKDVEALFAGMRRTFELEDRFRALEFRLNFIQDTSVMVLDLMQTRKSYLIEVVIVALFVFDIVLVLYELFLK
jgi:uncharacterized Rmd1/YagE family protein